MTRSPLLSRDKLVEFLESSALPHTTSHHHDNPLCDRECHITERNYTLALIRSYVTSVH